MRVGSVLFLPTGGLCIPIPIFDKIPAFETLRDKYQSIQQPHKQTDYPVGLAVDGVDQYALQNTTRSSEIQHHDAASIDAISPFTAPVLLEIRATNPQSENNINNNDDDDSKKILVQDESTGEESSNATMASDQEGISSADDKSDEESEPSAIATIALMMPPDPEPMSKDSTTPFILEEIIRSVSDPDDDAPVMTKDPSSDTSPIHRPALPGIAKPFVMTARPFDSAQGLEEDGEHLRVIADHSGIRVQVAGKPTETVFESPIHDLILPIALDELGASRCLELRSRSAGEYAFCGPDKVHLRSLIRVLDAVAFFASEPLSSPPPPPAVDGPIPQLSTRQKKLDYLHALSQGQGSHTASTPPAPVEVPELQIISEKGARPKILFNHEPFEVDARVMNQDETTPSSI